MISPPALAGRFLPLGIDDRDKAGFEIEGEAMDFDKAENDESKADVFEDMVRPCRGTASVLVACCRAFDCNRSFSYKEQKKGQKHTNTIGHGTHLLQSGVSS